MKIMKSFEFTGLPWRIVFGPGSVRQLPGLLERLGLHRALVLSTPELASQVRLVMGMLGDHAAGLFDHAVMHVPREVITAAWQNVLSVRADCSISIGGGSATGLGKALKLEHDLPHIAIPTTYAGSEMTNGWGITEGGTKTTGRETKVLPMYSIYDPELTLSLPPEISGPSGINALAQAVVNVCVQEPNPIVLLLAEEAIRILGASLPTVVAEPKNLEARTEAMYGACLAGAALGTGITGIHHRLCHILGGSFGMPHAETHTILLPHTVAYNGQAVPDGTARVANALGVKEAAEGIYDLARLLGAKMALREFGMKATDLDEVAKLATATPCPNPAPVTRNGIRRLLQAAFNGERPE